MTRGYNSRVREHRYHLRTSKSRIKNSLAKAADNENSYYKARSGLQGNAAAYGSPNKYIADNHRTVSLASNETASDGEN
jgi:hypothetical protein